MMKRAINFVLCFCMLFLSFGCNVRNINNDGGTIGIKGDLSESKYVVSKSPENYGTTAKLITSTTEVSEDSKKSLKGVFSSQNLNNTHFGAIWTWVDFNIYSMNGSKQVDLSQKTLSMDIKMENCSIESSIILQNLNKSRSGEKFFKISSDSMFDGIKYENKGEWTRITINLFNIFGYDNQINIEEVSNIFIMFNNNNCDFYSETTFYMDNVKLQDSKDESESDVPVYNPSGFYNKTDYLNIYIAGNSFIGSSNAPYWLDRLFIENNVYAQIQYNSIGYGRIADHLKSMSHWPMQADVIDVMFIQDFYGYEDVTSLGQLLTELNRRNPTAEVMVYPAENESNHGAVSAELYGLDLVDWKTLLINIKTYYPEWNSVLNYRDDDIRHSTLVAGFMGAILQYRALFGAIPIFDSTLEQFMYDTEYTIPGNTIYEKKENVVQIINNFDNWLL